VIKYKINGKEVTKAQWDARKGVGLKGGVPMGTIAYSESDPLISEGLGCMRSQLQEFREMVKEEKIQGVAYLDSGQARITSRDGRKALMKALSERRGCRYVDADGGYGDG
jgi:hypothetical protein